MGRDSEHDYLVDALTGGGSRGVVIAGDRGVGKTRLACQVVETLEAAGWSVSTHVATEPRSTVPFAAFASLLDDATNAPDPLQRMLGATAQLIGPQRPRVLLHVEDGQWLDDESLAFVHHVAESTGATVLLTVRSSHPKAGAVRTLERSLDFARLQLQPLSKVEVETLLRRVRPQIDPDAVHRLWRLTQGNPLYLHEVVTRSDEQGRPTEFDAGGLAEVVDARLDDLEPGQLEALELVTVGGQAPLTYLSDLAGPEALMDLERRQLVKVVESGRRSNASLAHPIYGEVVAARMGLMTRRSRRAQLLADAERHGRRRHLDLVQTAVWATEHGDPVDPEMLLAVVRRFSGFSHDEDDLTSIHLLPPLKGGLVGSAARLAKSAVDAGGGFAAAHSWFQAEAHLNGQSPATAEALAAMSDLAVDEQQRTLVLTAVTDLHVLNGWEAPTQIIEGLQDYRNDLGTGAARRSIDAHLTLTTSLFGRFDEAIELGQGVLADPATTARDRLLTVGPMVGSLAAVGRSTEALALADRAIGEIGPDADQWSVGALVFARITALACIGRLADAAALAEQFLLVAEATGARSGVILFGTTLGQIGLSRGRPADALEAAERALATESPAGIEAHRSAAHACAAHAHALLGHRAQSTAALERAAAAATSSEVFSAAMMRARAWVAIGEGRQRAGIEVLYEAAAEGLTGAAGTMTCLHELVRLGERGLSARMRALLDDGADGDLWVAACAHAEAFDAADGARLDDAAEELARLGSTLAAAEAAAQAAVAHAHAGNRNSSVVSRDRSLALAAECQGATTPTLAIGTDSVQRLTRRELEVARLAARRRSDREIAGELHLSVRTVHSHLYRVYAKLGINGRAELESHPEL